ncbi:MAG: TauD/TfdA family dioxygenase [Burkholderiales bacterium]|nr:TauD/TfdA family dioxygenase [Burkholderiales bacterium]MDP2398108.1 TauD/TfdA family dioxygenase [Burkholderiales bacterium]
MVTPRPLIRSPDAWVGAEIQHDPAWICRLDEADIAEIDTTLARAKGDGLRIPFDSAAFPLPRLGAKLDGILNEIENGRGFQLIRGIPRLRYSDADCELIYWGITSYFGTPVSQNARGHLLGHVRDEGRQIEDPNARAYQTNGRMDFHTDMLPIDVLGLFCLRTAKSGGASKLTSALTIHNVLREERPDLLEVLYGLFHLDWRGEEPAGEEPWFSIPMFSECEGRITARICSLVYYESAARFGEQYRPTALQREVLLAVQEIANRPELMLSMDFQEGDIQLINNHTMLHAREAYEDYPEPARQRHLLRMWIAVPDGKRRPLAAGLTDRYRWVQRGGIPAKIPAAV